MKTLIFLSSLLATLYAQCPNDPNYFQGTNKNTCYMVSQWEDTYREAVRTCNIYNGNLTSIHDSFNDRAIYQWVAKNSTDKPGTVWIGAQKDTHTVPATWTWVDGQPWNYNNWATGQPDNNPAYPYNYAYMDTIDGKWYVDEDWNTKFFVCEVPVASGK